MKKINSIQEILNSSDPLTQDSANFLVNYKEEDTLVDYKLTFENSEKEWLELTKDISAFANTHGGFLLFGIKDESKEIIGLSRETIEYLKDANLVLQKINRNLEPEVTEVRTKIFQIEDKAILIIFIPQSNEKTHMISKDGEFIYPSKKKQVVLKEGTFYVRHSEKTIWPMQRTLKRLSNAEFCSFEPLC